MKPDLGKLTIVLANMGLKNKDFSVLELVKASLDRINRFDKKIKAFLTICDKEALEKAKQADLIIAKDKSILDKNLLFGLPYSAKDVFCTKGIKTTASSKILEDYLPPYSATVIEKLDRAGAILIGKTNCDPFGFGSSTENSGYQITHNPWNLNKVPGGSSGGSAAAVSAGMGLFSLAEDTGGSIRQPASFCSVAGIKVSYGRVSRYGVIAYGSSLDTIGAIAKNVADLAIITKEIAGKDEKDATTLPIEVSNYYKNIKNKLNKIVFGVPSEYFTKDLDKEIKKAIETSIKEFFRLGFEIKEISLAHTKYAIPAYYLAGISEVSANLARYDGIRFGHLRDNFEPEVKRRIMLGTYALSSGYYEAYYKKAMQVRTLIKQDFDEAFKKVDCIIAPVSPFPPFSIGEKSSDPLKMWLADVYTVTINPAGIPGLAIPCGFTKNNLPIGMQLIGPQFSEELLFQIGHLYQEKTTWHQRQPKIT